MCVRAFFTFTPDPNPTPTPNPDPSPNPNPDEVCVRAFFTFTSGCMLVAYALAMCSQPSKREHGQLWMSVSSSSSGGISSSSISSR